MIAYVLLRGKDFAIPDSVSVAIIGLFFGLIAGLFYYQKYEKTWYWWISLVGGLLLTYLFHIFFTRSLSLDDTSSMVQTIAGFIVPFSLTMILNHMLSLVKNRKRKMRTKRKLYSSFFDSVSPGEALTRKAPR